MPETAIVVEVVDEGGVRLMEGGVDLWLADPGVEAPSIRDCPWLYTSHALIEANPLVLDVPAPLLGARLRVEASSGTRSPVRQVFQATAGQHTRIQLVLAVARSLAVVTRDAETGRPVPGARVISVTEQRRRAVLSVLGEEGPEGPGGATTGARGECVLNGLGPGRHLLEVFAEGYAVAAVSDADPDGEVVIVDLVPMRDTGAIRIRVRGPQGRAVPDVVIDLWSTERETHLRKATDERGVVTFSGLPPGSPIVQLWAPSWGPITLERGWDLSSARGLEFVDVEVGVTKRVELGFMPGLASCSGTIVDDRGLAAGELELELDGPVHLATRTRLDGRFDFERVPAGSYSIHLSGTTEWWLGEDLVFEDAGHRDLDLEMGRHTLRGRVVDDGNQQPVAGARIIAMGERHALTVTNHEGRFRLDDALAGTYVMTAAHVEYSPARVTLETGHSEETSVEIRLTRR